MKRMLQMLALTLVVGGVAAWLAAGAHRGWTQTSVPVKTLDEVTGIEAISYRRQWVPGLDFLGAALLGGGLLAAASLWTRNKPKPRKQP